MLRTSRGAHLGPDLIFALAGSSRFTPDHLAPAPSAFARPKPVRRLCPDPSTAEVRTFVIIELTRDLCVRISSATLFCWSPVYRADLWVTGDGYPGSDGRVRADVINVVTVDVFRIVVDVPVQPSLVVVLLTAMQTIPDHCQHCVQAG